MTREYIERLVNHAEEECNRLGYSMMIHFHIDDVIDKDGNIYAESDWYGGDMITLTNKAKNIMIVLEANGDVEATLCRKSDNTVLVDMKDRHRAGHFRDEMKYYIHGDEELKKALYDDGEYQLDFQANNWYEGFVCKDDADCYTEFYDVVDGDILEILRDITSLIEWAEQD